ncbi:hypothetical protein [Deinococcus cellulosilyticus]|uniref:Uncharacterized protein n=1 Tax=Deinococcus cellulosilyticus (strain DSM 18568 / NBRC 106333 / KACC 11606 / 5516J-15) TaxID=1223518 RepID=A0A511N895_DEIC1|nr:hypothetical protein [Deinococcus cellulosilyticus]GEM48651.1 hypothetical protein DC3_42860 [Deinococcus cellulosilyticus NBRC 106333 = KACC 11606]
MWVQRNNNVLLNLEQFTRIAVYQVQALKTVETTHRFLWWTWTTTKEQTVSTGVFEVRAQRPTQGHEVLFTGTEEEAWAAYDSLRSHLKPHQLPQI